MTTKIYRILPLYLNLKFIYALRFSSGVIQSQHNKATTICQKQEEFCNKSDKIRGDIQLSVVPYQR